MLQTPLTLLGELRDRANAGAWARFVELFAPLVFRWAEREGLQTADAEETVQDVFLILLQRMATYEHDPARSFRAYLATITRRVAHRRRAGERVGDVLAEPIAPDDCDEAERREYAAWVMQRAARLIQNDFEPATWEAFRRFVLDDRPAAEVAQELGISRNAVYLSVRRVTERLRTELAEFLE